MSDVHVTILGIDPSSDRTGIALVQFDARGCPVRSVSAALSSASKLAGLTGRYNRIRDTRHKLALFLSRQTCAFDAVAYESPYSAGVAASVINQAIGAYLSLSQFDGLPVWAIAPATVKTVSGQGGKKRAAAKLGTVAWANRFFGLALSDDEDARADALCVAVAAWRARVKAGQTKMALKPARKKVAI